MDTFVKSAKSVVSAVDGKVLERTVRKHWKFPPFNSFHFILFVFVFVFFSNGKKKKTREIREIRRFRYNWESP